MTAQVDIAQIASEVSTCTSCVLHQTRTMSVPGEGPDNAEIMLIGEGPGATEDAQGRPFIGTAGKFLVELLAQAGLKRTDVFICNVVKCRPPLNRDPMPEELAACSLFLNRQIEAINPKIIITLGRFSMAKFMPDVKISMIHGQMRRIKIPHQDDRFVIAMFHPAAALHQPPIKPVILADFAKLPQQLEAARNGLKSPEPKTGLGNIQTASKTTNKIDQEKPVENPSKNKESLTIKDDLKQPRLF